MTRPPVETVLAPADSQVESFAYNRTDSTLTVHFRNSRRPYTHTRVPREVFAAWKDWNKAGYSSGSFYHSHVKPPAQALDQTRHGLILTDPLDIAPTGVSLPVWQQPAAQPVTELWPRSSKPKTMTQP